MLYPRSAACSSTRAETTLIANATKAGNGLAAGSVDGIVDMYLRLRQFPMEESLQQTELQSRPAGTRYQALVNLCR